MASMLAKSTAAAAAAEVAAAAGRFGGSRSLPSSASDNGPRRLVSPKAAALNL